MTFAKVDYPSVYHIVIKCFSTEKALIERALELRSELEDAASDITNLFTKIGMHS